MCKSEGRGGVSCTYVFGQFGHVGLEEPLYLVLALVVGVEVGPAVRTAHVLAAGYRCSYEVMK